MERLHNYSDKRGEDLLNHKPHCKIKDLPEEVQPGANAFANAVLKAEHPRSPDNGSAGGASPKSFYKVGGGRFPNGRIKPSLTFMVKPYFEDFDDWEGTYYPISGFAEMATQGIMHAAGLGDSTLKVHTFEDPKNKSKPLLAVEFNRGFKRVGDMGNLADNITIPDHVQDKLAKIGIIDYITNNQDRHSSNLMASLKFNGPAKASVERLLAIDHGRSFQYRVGCRFASNCDSMEHFMYHLGSPAIYETLNPDGREVNRKLAIQRFLTPKRFSAMTEWWKDKRKDIQDSFNEHAKTIKDPQLKKWITSNFKERIATMDKLVKHWDKSGKKKDDIRALDPEHITDFVGAHAQKFVNGVRRNPHGESFLKYGDNDRDEDEGEPDESGRRWCTACNEYH